MMAFGFFRNLQIKNSAWINTIATTAFGVYLIHDHLLVRGRLWDMVSLPSQCDQWQYPFVVIGLCVLIFVVCALIDAIRKKLFSALKIDHFITRVDKWSIYSS